MTRGTDECLHSVGVLPRLRVLELWDTDVTDAGLDRLQFVDQLTELVTLNADLTDRGLATIGRAAQLKNLKLDTISFDFADKRIPRGRFTDRGFESLVKLQHLKFLSVEDNGITDEAFRSLAMLPCLKHLWIFGTRLQGAGFRYFVDQNQIESVRYGGAFSPTENYCYLRNFSNIRTLWLLNADFDDRLFAALHLHKKLSSLYLEAGAPKITGACMAHLSKMTSLEVLMLPCSMLTDDDLVGFQELKNLKSLHLNYTRITANRVVDLKKAMPQLFVEWSSPKMQDDNKSEVATQVHCPEEDHSMADGS